MQGDRNGARVTRRLVASDFADTPCTSGRRILGDSRSAVDVDSRGAGQLGSPGGVTTDDAQPASLGGRLSLDPDLLSGHIGRLPVALSSMTNAISLASGPSVGAAILITAGWRWIFLINLPIGIAGLIAGSIFLPSSRRQRLVTLGEGLDVRSMTLSILFLPLFLIGCDRLAFEPLTGLAIVAFSLIVALLLVARQRRQSHQMIPIELFRQPVFSLSLVCSSMSFLALNAAYTALPFLFEHDTANTMRDVALFMMIPPLFTAAANAGTVVLLRYIAEIQLCSLGMLAMALGLVGLALGQPGGPMLYLALGLLGFGFGIFKKPNNRMILGAAAADRSGNVSGTLAVARTIGQTGGSTVVSVSLAIAGQAGGVVALCIGATSAAISGVFGLGRR